MRVLVAEKFLAFLPEETSGDGDVVIALLEDEPTGYQASPPLVVFRSMLAAISGNVFLGNAVDDGPNSGPHARPGAHGTGLVRGVEDKVRQVAPIPAAHVFERFQLHVFDAGARSLHAISGARNHHFASKS